jgi:hypothetical protein
MGSLIARSSTTSNGDCDHWAGGPSGFCRIRNGGVVSVELVQDMCRAPRGIRHSSPTTVTPHCIPNLGNAEMIRLTTEVYLS